MELADEVYASRVAAVLIASFPYLAKDSTQEAMRQLTRNLIQVLTGKPKAIVARIVDPETGVPAKSEFLSAAVVNAWLAKNLPAASPIPYKELGGPDLEPWESEDVSPEERERRYQMLKQLAVVIRETADKKRIGPRADAPGIQRHDPDALIAALNNRLT